MVSGGVQFNTRKTTNPIKKWAKDPNRCFSKEDLKTYAKDGVETKMPNKHMKIL